MPLSFQFPVKQMWGGGLLAGVGPTVCGVCAACHKIDFSKSDDAHSLWGRTRCAIVGGYVPY